METPAFEALGDRLTTALIKGDFELYRACFAFPLSIAPREGRPYVLADIPALREDFELYHAVIRQHGVTDIFRQLVAQEAAGPGRMRFHCLTHLMARAHRLVDPFATHFLMEERPEGWRITQIESSEGHITWTLGRAEISPDGRFDSKERPTDAEN